MSAYIDLLDANVWVPLSAPDHALHIRAREYWERKSAPQVAFCRITALAFIRLTMNPRVMQHAALTSAKAWDAYQAWLDLPEVVFIDEAAELDTTPEALCHAGGFGASGLTDAYLAACAMTAACRFVTFDGGFRKFEALDLLLLQQ